MKPSFSQRKFFLRKPTYLIKYVFFQKYFYSVTVLQLFSKSLKKTHVKWFTFSRVADLEPKTLPKKDLLHEFYSRILKTSRKHLFWGTIHGGCFCIKAPKRYFTERFLADTFKEDRTIHILPYFFKFIKEAAIFSNNLISRHFL